MIDYPMAGPASGPVIIKVFDQSGTLVNRFSSDDKVPPLDLSGLAVAPEWVVSPKPPAATPGHHRFVWDLHYARPSGFTERTASPAFGRRPAGTRSKSRGPARRS